MKVDALGQQMEFITDDRLFSPSGADRGTMAMLGCARFQPGERVLDLGCGWGLVGTYAARIVGEQNVVMTDIDRRAVDLAIHNAALNGVRGVSVVRSDGFHDLNETGFDWILVNPPYHADFSVARHFIEKGFNRLKMGGRMLMVTKRLDWYRNKLHAIFGGVKVTEIDGYYIFEAERRSMRYANKSVG